MLKLYIINILLGIDQLGNTILGGDPDETISSRTAKHRNEFPWSILAAFLEWLNPGHLDQAEFNDMDEGSKGVFPD